MADLRVTGGANLPTAQPARLSEAARSAQRAFFQAALNGVAPTAATTSATTSQTAAPAPLRAPASQPAAAPEAGRYLRPGSLLDIKV